MKRRDFLYVLAAGGLRVPRGHAYSPYPVKFRLPAPYEAAQKFVEPGLDEFPAEKQAMEIESTLRTALDSGRLPADEKCTGSSPAPREYRAIGPGVSEAVFGGGEGIAAGWKRWRESLGSIRRARFYVLPGDEIRYDIRGQAAGRMEQRTGTWKYGWAGGKLTHLQPAGETLIYSERPWFRDVTGHVFDGEPTFRHQLLKGVPYWRARLDPACGIDLYGENGVAVADIDQDGEEEIYVCQPGGLPNRLYKGDGNGRLRDISAASGLDILDDTACALFVDLRNSGRQDLVLVRGSEPMLFLNDGKGRFTASPEAFRFATAPQGSFTSVSAADYDRDGRLDLYFCSYVYYQSEAQYRYPAPYHDAQNGPPNFLFRNRMDQRPGYFEDVTAAAGMNQNNNRFSFAAAWCDYNGDGWPDLYVTNDFGRNNLYRNSNGHFRDVAEEAGVVDLGPGMSAAWVDYDGDGRPDLLVSNMWSASGQRIVNDPAFGPAARAPELKEAYCHHVKGNSLYHNRGDGSFAYTGASEGIEIVPWSWSCDGCDFDNDGTPELYIACGMLTNNSGVDLMSYFYRQVVSKSPVKNIPAPEYENGWNAINQLVRQEYSWAGAEPNVFFARRAGRYYDFSGVSGIDVAEDSRAFAFTDIDGDGHVDLVLKSRLGPQVRVFQNRCGTGRERLVISLRGSASNRDGIGARVEVDGQVKWLAAGSAYLSQHTKRLHFGLGEEGQAKMVRIQWPSGEVQELGPLAAGFHYLVTEGSAEVTARPLRARTEWPEGAPIEANNQARLETTWLWEPVPLPEKRRGPAVLLVHAGEALPELGVAFDTLDLRQAGEEVAAGYAILRRYLFDYRVDLETPLWLLIDGESRLRKIYAKAPAAAEVQADLGSLAGALPEARGLPFPGYYIAPPRRDYYKFGGALLQAGYPEQALPYLEEMLRRSPENAKALLAAGTIHLRAKRYSEARQALERALQINPDLPEGWNEMGGVEAGQGRLREALADYERALAIQPEFPYALLNAAQMHDRLGDAAQAERLYRRALTLDGSKGEAANALGLLLAKQGRNAEARELFQAAIASRHDDAAAINNLGVLYLNMGQVKDAIAAFQYGIKVAPGDETLYLNLARVWVQMGEREKAADVMRALQARNPSSAIAKKALKELSIQ